MAAADSNSAAVNSIEADSAARYTDALKLMQDKNVQAVYLATLPDIRCELAIAALEKGLHVICEKPMASTADQCRQMVEAAKKAKRMLVVDFECRYYKHLRQLRQWIVDGRLGDVGAMHFQSFWDGHKNFGAVAERRARLMEQAGALDCGIHQLDLARYLSGGGHWTDISALGAWLGEDHFKFPPHIAILGKLDSGVIATINASLGYGSSIEPRPKQELLTVAGSRGVASLSIDADSPQAFNATKATLNLYSETGIERCPVEHPPHNQAIGWVVDDLASTLEMATGETPVLPETNNTDSILPQGIDGLEAQIAVEKANAAACAAKVQ